MNNSPWFYIIYPIFVIIVSFVITKTNYLELIIPDNKNIDKFYTDILIIGVLMITFRIVTKKMW
ncbi:hypothetical protein MOVS_00355 [Moraxella ovis]|uniref:Uncharacterized protein n=1 Tax=Moraxella ovis TaxID=29433 RepID=A0A378PHC0_9GAMM|nr:hypothetical protein [Moraxella ovis]ANB90711.1 hypothetical protein MOVS_00355 [Moraxella ovis]STY86112.1 Uncharacterised protein [Moraxella ovis]